MGNLASKLLEDVAQMQSQIASLEKAVAKLSKPSGASRGVASVAKEGQAELLEFLQKGKGKTKNAKKVKPKASWPSCSDVVRVQLDQMIPALLEHQADFDNSALVQRARELLENAKIKSVALAYCFDNQLQELALWLKDVKNRQILDCLEAEKG